MNDSKYSLPILSRVSIANPCKQDWAGMSGDERVRHCGSCEKSVFNLSGMTRESAESLLANNGSSICVRFYQRSDGTVMTADCPPSERKKPGRGLRVAAMAAVAMLGVGCATTLAVGDDPDGARDAGSQIELEPMLMMGEMVSHDFLEEGPDPTEEQD